MAKFGKTWWGEQWLNALSNIDYSNRLPRGRAYANNGSVTSMTVKDNEIVAKVKGSRRTPYKIMVTVPAYSKLQKDKLMKAILADPMLLSTLLNRELPEQLSSMAQKQGIPVFPKEWTDLAMDCSCPDWAVPCKHLAAVIYKIVNEIDQNPFALFQLRGLDILAELEQNGAVITEVAIPEAKAFITPDCPVVKLTDKSLGVIDFSTIPPLRDTLLELLESKPIFADKDIKAILKKSYTATAKAVIQLEKETDTPEITLTDFVDNYQRYEQVQVVLQNEVFYHDTICSVGREELHFQQSRIGELMDYLREIPYKYIEKLTPHMQTLCLAFRFSEKLLEQSAYIPDLLQLRTGEYRVRWTPALMNAEVKKVYRLLTEFCPPDLVQVSGMSFNLQYIAPNEQIKALCSVFLDYMVDYCTPSSALTAVHRGTKLLPVDRLIFTYSVYAFEEMGEQETPNSIYKWLSPFHLSSQQYVPLLKVDELEEDTFEVGLYIENREKKTEPIAYAAFMKDRKQQAAQIPVLRSLAQLAQYFPDIEGVVSSKGKNELVYSAQKFTQILLNILPVVELLGIRILLPTALKHIVKPKRSISLEGKKSEESKGFLSLDKMLDFEWKVALGDQQIAAKEFTKLVDGVSGLVKIKNQYVLIDPAEVQKLLRSLAKEPKLNVNDLLQVALTEEWESAKVKISAKAKKIVQDLLKTEHVALPEGLQATFRPYQFRGYEWLYRNVKAGFGSILADDMGLGKTIQVIATLLKLKEEGNFTKQKAMVVVPTSLLTNWGKEMDRFAPTLRWSAYHGPNRELELEEIDVLLTTYGILRSDSTKLGKIKWASLVIDEAQNIKNAATEQTKAIKKIKANVKIAMSGTPVENRLSEYWSIFDFVNKGYLGSLNYFRKEFSRPIEAERDHQRLEQFKTIAAPFVMRRLKTDKSIISDLPSKIENDKYLHLTPEQTALYKSVVTESLATIEEAKDGGQTQRLGLVFKMMTALKQVCNHPSQYLKEENSDPELSGKALVLLNLLDNIYESNEKVLIFTQYREMGDLLQKIINQRYHQQVNFLHGGCSRKQRDEMVDSFQNSPQQNTFILSIKAGGTGLNLTAANHVIHYDLWWNPAVENQATDRAFRIGQKKNVMVYRLIAQGTFEEKINKMLQDKKELADLTVSQGEKWIGDFSNAELQELVSI